MELEKITEHHRNGSIYREYFVNENGELHGEFKGWYENGNQRVICNWQNGELHGEFKGWYINGQQWEISNYQNSKLHGEYKEWQQDGTLIFDGELIQAKPYSYGVCKVTGKIKIGCRAHAKEYWLDNYREIAREEDVDENDIEFYLNKLK